MSSRPLGGLVKQKAMKLKQHIADVSKMEKHNESPNEDLHIVFMRLIRIARLLYGIVFWIALAVQILSSVLTWSDTVTYEYFCGNPLMGSWAQWFVISLIMGILALPGGVWSIRHRNERTGIIFLIGLLLYLLSMIFMLIAGVVIGTVPDFINFIDYAFG
jgi:hypothetical protein